jgi:hypothetical protein
MDIMVKKTVGGCWLLFFESETISALLEADEPALSSFSLVAKRYENGGKSRRRDGHQ